ncbi:MAG: hypothetical protein IJ496_04715 [Ruminococcus sp.]|nr:hypothetical protein [Ruminococcus sp.]
MKNKIAALLCGMLLLFCGPAVPASAGTTTAIPAAEIVQEAEETETGNEPSKTVKIVQFLVIFTVAMGVTAYIVVRPKLKLLKDAQAEAKKEK